jgi:hypothetical protein
MPQKVCASAGLLCDVAHNYTVQTACPMGVLIPRVVWMFTHREALSDQTSENAVGFFSDKARCESARRSFADTQMNLNSCSLKLLFWHEAYDSRVELTTEVHHEKIGGTLQSRRSPRYGGWRLSAHYRQSILVELRD